jgi:hypothetical protein
MRIAAFISVAAFVLGSCAQEADDDGNFYAAKTISYIVATDPGGGYDSRQHHYSQRSRRRAPGRCEYAAPLKTGRPDDRYFQHGPDLRSVGWQARHDF